VNVFHRKYKSIEHMFDRQEREKVIGS